MNTGGFMGGLYRICEWIMRFSVTNVLWLLFNLPVVYLGLTLLFVENMNEMMTILTTMAILAPFIFFPATTAMFGVVRKWVLGEQDIPLFRSFWQYYKENYVRSMCGGLLFIVLSVICIVDLIFFSTQKQPVLFYFFIFLSVFLFVIVLNFFSNTVHFHTPFLASVKNAILLSIAKPFNTLLTFATNAAIVVFSFQVATFLIPFFMGSLCAYLSFVFYYRAILQVEAIRQKKNGNLNES